jgi:hypothetical protein
VNVYLTRKEAKIHTGIAGDFWCSEQKVSSEGVRVKVGSRSKKNALYNELEAISRSMRTRGVSVEIF